MHAIRLHAFGPAENLGATVIGLAGGPAKVARVAGNGADLAVDYTRPDWPEEVRAHLGDRGATVVFDSVGGASGRAGRGCPAYSAVLSLANASSVSRNTVQPSCGSAPSDR